MSARAPAVARVVAIGLALLVAAIPVSAQVFGSNPWQFPDDETRRQLRRDTSGYWYSDYEAAIQDIDSDRPDTLRKVINRLRFSIADKQSSSANETHPRLRHTFDYTPYYLLAVAFDKLGEFDNAVACLDREKGFGVIGRTEYAAAFSTLEQRLTAIAAQQQRRSGYGALLAEAEAVQGWTDGGDGIRLTSGGRTAVAAVSAAADRLRQLAAATSPDPQQESAAFDALIDGLANLHRGELNAHQNRLLDLSANWERAFGSRRDLIDPTGCAMPEGRNAATLTRARQTLVACTEQVLQATRQAGSWACDRLQGERRRIADALTATRRLQEGAAPGSAPALPGACGTDWARADIDQAASQLNGIQFSRVEGEWTAQATRAESALAEIRRQVYGSAQAAVERIPNIEAGCANTLGLVVIRRELERLRGEPARVEAGGGDSSELADLEGQVTAALARLEPTAAQGARRVLEEGRQYDGVDETSLQALESALQAFEGGAGGGALGNLCGAATRANREIASWLANNQDALLARLDEYRWLLGAAVDNDRIHRSPTEEPESGTDCVATTLESLPTGRPSRNPDAWARRSQQAMAEADACLQTREGERQQEAVDLTNRTARVVGVLEEMGTEGTGALAAIAGRASRVQDEIRTYLSPLQGAESLVQGELAPSDGASLRQAIQTAGLEAEIPVDWWSRVDGLSASGDRFVRARFLVADRGRSAALGELSRRLPGWEQLASAIGPYAGLRKAYDAYLQGRLDDAILALRQTQAGRSVPARGRGTALTHASLAYFLYLKAQAEESGSGGLGERLRQDAEREAALAAGADEGFRPPPSLFESRGFRSFYASCCGGAAEETPAEP